MLDWRLYKQQISESHFAFEAVSALLESKLRDNPYDPRDNPYDPTTSSFSSIPTTFTLPCSHYKIIIK